jgi:D-alanine-D-alanine ligase
MTADDRTDLPVLLIHNIDPEWPEEDAKYARKQVLDAVRALRGVGHPVTSVTVRQPDLRRALRRHTPEEFIVLNWCEALPGVERSEPMVARQLEELGFTFTGASSRVLELSCDKARSREAMLRARVPVPEGRIFEKSDGARWDRYPAIVKPIFEHSSIGISAESVVENRGQLRSQLEQVLEDFGPALVEEFIDGREFRVGVWGNRRPFALPPGEMDFREFPAVRDRLCSYDAKFTPGSEHYEQIIFRLPAPVTRIEGRLLERAAVGAHKAVGSPDYTRIDLRLRQGVCYVLDVNPNADISADASMALCAQAAGIPYGAMLSHYVNLAAARHPRFAHQRRTAAVPDRRPVQLALALGEATSAVVLSD